MALNGASVKLSDFFKRKHMNAVEYGSTAVRYSVRAFPEQTKRNVKPTTF